MTQLQLAQHAEIEKLVKQNQVMKELATRIGFYNYYFKTCKTAAPNLEAFNLTNDLYFELFKEYRYTDYNSFRRSVNHYLTNIKK